MAQVLTATVVAPKPKFLKLLGATVLNVASIQSIQTRTADAESAGITAINYRYSVGNHVKSEIIFVSESRAALTTLANANATAT